ncbi:Uma2 family endonuclease [Sphingomonas rubra]|uniref:Endonuclease, Uma2 family (Restriction endonuclease fold) n=1 Tax=Sphingomonas rubra TaxID=634430 RepID=A0A1I5R867_9SPHN|nr:Uma2 family endonuclease [Sphingomonas rubra]SFP54590.1 Endonuclease, Uma2 family (restriction endonuclease fold) [Sphingomonas rubra]
MNKPARIDLADAREIAPSSKARFTTAEFLHMVESGAFDDMKVELVGGELERMPPPGSTHASRQVKIIVLLSAVVSSGRLLGEVGLDLGDDTLLGCDLAVLHAPVEGNRMVLPSEVVLVVEVAETTASRDRGMKRLAYARADIPTYWVVDGKLGLTHVYSEPRDGDYAEIATVRFGESLAVPGTAATITID